MPLFALSDIPLRKLAYAYLGRMTISKDEAALALFSGVLGAFLHSSAE
jgi:hypothetical protein